jgi:hypothetical protein
VNHKKLRVLVLEATDSVGGKRRERERKQTKKNEDKELERGERKIKPDKMNNTQFPSLSSL